MKTDPSLINDVDLCVAHTLWADHTVTYYQFSSVLTPGIRRDHMTDGVPPFDAHRGGGK